MDIRPIIVVGVAATGFGVILWATRPVILSGWILRAFAVSLVAGVAAYLIAYDR